MSFEDCRRAARGRGEAGTELRSGILRSLPLRVTRRICLVYYWGRRGGSPRQGQRSRVVVVFRKRVNRQGAGTTKGRGRRTGKLQASYPLKMKLRSSVDRCKSEVEGGIQVAGSRGLVLRGTSASLGVLCSPAGMLPTR